MEFFDVHFSYIDNESLEESSLLMYRSRVVLS